VIKQVGYCLGVILILLLCSLGFNLCLAVTASDQKEDAIFILGGDLRLMVYAAQIALKHPEKRILISGGSPQPCAWILFDTMKAPMQNVWLEGCADSTFTNFFYSVPILKEWNVHKIRLVTSSNHLPRAKDMAQILLPSQGISINFDILDSNGIPANPESPLKTKLDLTRSTLWAPLSQAIKPRCNKVIRLSDVDMSIWRKKGFNCHPLPPDLNEQYKHVYNGIAQTGVE
jgi:uncharacterized SAM-binding protein YcdF (DUF218 family)